MTYYVNQVYLLGVDNGVTSCIGLFKFADEFRCHGEGNFCGYYSSEYFDDVTLLGYYTQPNVEFGNFIPRGQVRGDNVVINQHYDSIRIGYGPLTLSFDADSDFDALNKFFAEDF